MRTAAFIAVGSELLRAERPETNSWTAARVLRSAGFLLAEKRVVEDTVAGVATAVRELVPRCEFVVVSGGLGPTADDVTREGVAAALGRALWRHEASSEAIAARYAARGRPMPEFAWRMADLVEGAELLPNPVGTAPGQWIELPGCTLVLLPGVPSELEAMLTGLVLPRLGPASGILTRTLRLAGVYESLVEQRVRHLYERFGRENVTILAARGQVSLLLLAAGPDAATQLEEMDREFATLAGPDLFGRDDDTLASAVLAALRRRGWTLAVGESCTGGLVASQLVAVAGASDVFVGGAVAYADALKRGLLGVRDEVLSAQGAVSREVAEAMADGARALGASCGLGITGIAGPTGGTPDKPVGTVHMTAVTPEGRRHQLHRFPGDRQTVRELTAVFALDLLRRLVAFPDGNGGSPA
ncbi:MAG TPA: CinA family nicotinamide mononucleotide deamidase-related protein [Thermoanaerobaculaceae bacterium]|nr:CinA family nicotinamide mononucleotide deamidase-related protein [Thermoanaerobaculaceae bacterium]HRS16051.1 CinA family nicotinamide mononucleotide deamidase-related protein [Thermoanaerobaculaceae bacterium]